MHVGYTMLVDFTIRAGAGLIHIPGVDLLESRDQSTLTKNYRTTCNKSIYFFTNYIARILS